MLRERPCCTSLSDIAEAVPAAPAVAHSCLIVASTGGNVQTDVEVNGKPVFVGLNAYIKK